MLSLDQQRAVRSARAALDRRGGVLLADRTGAGKTFLALAMIEDALARGQLRILVTGPAALAPQWLPLLRRAARAHGARALAYGRRSSVASAAVTWLSHTMLSLGRWPASIEPVDLVVVDEAHAFRNPATRRYRSLAWLCRTSRVALLTATPVNNSLMDLYFLFRLFVGDGALDDLGVPDLEAAFRTAADAGGPVRPPLDAAIEAMTVRTRRTLSPGHGPIPDTGSHVAPTDRRQVDGTFDGAGRGPDRRPGRVRPVPVRYDLATPEAVRFVIDGIRGLELSAHGVTETGGPAPGGELIRFGLVKRLESSVPAFGASARGLCRYLVAFADAARDGFWLSAGSHRSFSAGAPGQLLLAPLALPRLPAPFDPERLVRSALADAAAVRTVLRRLEEWPGGDRKLMRLMDLLGNPLAGRKTLIFTEFRDTALHLWKSLRRQYRVGLIHGGRAFLGDQPAGRLEVVRRFAPAANGGRPDPVRQVDILIATDVLAEGFNLQDAADVVSYDLPWNPVRLIQRVGRLDRWGSPHDEIRCHNFIPDRTLDLFLGLVDRIGAKLDTIRAGPGRAGMDRAFAGFGNGLQSRSGQSARGPGPGLHRVRAGGRVALPRSGHSSHDPMAQPGVDDRLPRPQSGRGASNVRLPGTGLLRQLRTDDPGLFDQFELASDPIAGLGLGSGHATAGPASPDIGGGQRRRLWIVGLAGDPGTTRLLVVRAQPGQDPQVSEEPLRSVQSLDRVARGRVRARAFVARLAGQPDADGQECEREGEAVAVAAAAADYLVERPPPGSPRTAAIIRDLLRIVGTEPGRPDAQVIGRVDRVVQRLRVGTRSGVEAAVIAAIARARAQRRVRPGRTVLLLRELEHVLGSGPDPRRDILRVHVVFELYAV
ncbi:MAG TPA: DEAD/DEAH box helicase [Longimicrobiales bacterium]|nr:DEAD/DEAH box helicase [Longimicrobiales bacterium]